MAPPSQSELRNPTTNHKVPTMSHTHTQFDLVRHTLNVVATHTHTLTFGATQEGLTAETRESPKVDTPTNYHLGYYWVPQLLQQGVVSPSSGPGPVSDAFSSPLIITYCHSVCSHWKKILGHWRVCVRFACWPGAVRRATEDRWHKGGGRGTPVIKAAPLLAATALGKSLKWQSGKSKWHERAWGNIANLSFCTNVKANEHIIYMGRTYKSKVQMGKGIQDEQREGKHWKTSEQSIWREIHTTTHHNNPYNQFQ